MGRNSMAERPGEHPDADDRLSELMADFARTLASEADLDSTLRRTTEAAVDIVPGAEAADILVLTGKSKFEYFGATSELPPKLDGIQVALGEGPCVSAALGDDVTISPDLRVETRWPRFAAAAVEEGVYSMLGFRLYTHKDSAGALNLFSSRPNAFDEDSVFVGRILAAHAAIAFLASRQGAQFQSALASRDLIGQAKGMLMERYGIDADNAFRTIVRYSQETNTPLASVAARIVDAGPDRPRPS